VREGNIIHVKDATGAQMTRIFGSATDFRGQLFDWVKAGRSKVYVYYSGHGAAMAARISCRPTPTAAGSSWPAILSTYSIGTSSSYPP